jgi:hypothetical protein
MRRQGSVIVVALCCAAGVPLAAPAASGHARYHLNRRSPVSVVRTMMVAGYGGDGITACAQLTRSLYQSLGGRSGCPANGTSLATPKREREAQTAVLTARIRGRRAGVGISSPDDWVHDPFYDSSLVHLILRNGVWKVDCLGYCHGESP